MSKICGVVAVCVWRFNFFATGLLIAQTGSEPSVLHNDDAPQDWDAERKKRCQNQILQSLLDGEEIPPALLANEWTSKVANTLKPGR